MSYVLTNWRDEQQRFRFSLPSCGIEWHIAIIYCMLICIVQGNPVMCTSVGSGDTGDRGDTWRNWLVSPWWWHGHCTLCHHPDVMPHCHSLVNLNHCHHNPVIASSCSWDGTWDYGTLYSLTNICTKERKKVFWPLDTCFDANSERIEYFLQIHFHSVKLNSCFSWLEHKLNLRGAFMTGNYKI